MHITIFVYGSWGDIRPHVVLGTALQKAGHEVRVAAAPGYEQWVRAHNLAYYPLTADVNTYAKENASILDKNILQQLQMARKAIQPIFAQMGLEMLEATRGSDLLMTVEFGLALLYDVVKANKLKAIFINPAPLNPTEEIACVAMPNAPHWFPFAKWYNRISYSMVRRLQWSLVSGPRNEIAGKLGLPKSNFEDFRAFVDNTPALTIVSRHVLQRPADWAKHFQVTGYLFDDDLDWTASQDLVDFLAAGDAPVYVGFGSMPDSKPEVTTRMMIDAVNKAGKRAVILTGWAGLGVDDPPENIYILKYAPHAWLFPQMAAAVHHGGSGTTAAGFRAGVPMVVVPHSADQPFWGRRVKELGVGAEPIPRKKLTADRLASAIREVTSNPEIQQNACKFGEKIRQEDGLIEAVKWVELYLTQVAIL